MVSDLLAKAKDIKPRLLKDALHLLPAKPLRAISSAMLDGATKYKPWNWTQETDDWRDIYGRALASHVAKWLDPTEPDYAEDSGVHHLAHAGACILIILFKLKIDFHMPNSYKAANGIPIDKEPAA